MRNFDSSVKNPIPALRCISKSLRRTGVRLTPRDLRALNLGAIYETVWFSTFYRPINFNLKITKKNERLDGNFFLPQAKPRAVGGGAGGRVAIPRK
jgi:hypothetical protein